MSGSSGFGRDEMTALIGGGLSERLTRTVANGNSSTANSSSKFKKGTTAVDVANLTTAETAAYLMEQDRSKGQKQKIKAPSRLRTTKVRNYHKLLLEEQQQRDAKSHQPEEESEDDEDMFNNETTSASTRPRKIQEPQIISSSAKKRPRPTATTPASSSDSEAPHDHRRRPRQDSSSSSSGDDDDNNSNGKLYQSRQRQDSSSSDDDDSVEERRKQRLAKSRLVRQQRHIAEPTILTKPENTSSISRKELNEGVPMRASESAPPPSRNSDSDGSSSSSSGSSSSEGDGDSSSGEDEDASMLVKPLFIPRHQRNNVQTATEKEHEEQIKLEKQQQEQKKRQRESRVLVQQVVAEAAKNRQQGEDPDQAEGEGITGARNAYPDDTDSDSPAAHDAWEVRELERLIFTIDLEENRRHEQAEWKRRRNMTDEERMKEDNESGRYNNDKKREKQSIQGRYYHRGAFYMDESEWGSDDVRRKAGEYAVAATGADKTDKSLLPEVMRVKNFGRANQNLRYKGLAAEDTTDRNHHVLPLLNDSKKKKERSFK